MSFRSARRDTSWVVIAKSTSWLGDMLAEVTLVLRTQAHGGGAGAVAALLVANALPIVLLSGVVGRLVDRVDNRRLLVSSSLGMAGVCLVLSAVTATASVLSLVAVLGVGQAVNAACWQALLATIASGDELTRAIGRAQAGTTAAGIGAPALAGLLTGGYGAALPLLADSAAYLLVAGVALLIVTRRVVTAATPGEKRRGGMAVVRQDGLLRRLFVLLGLFVLIGSMVNVVEVFLVRETLGASATWYGIAGAALSAGMLTGAVLAGALRGLSALARGFVGSAVLLALGITAAGAVPSVGWLLPASVLIGFGNGVLNVTLSSLVMRRAQPAERGRVGALLGGVASGTQLVAFATSGALAEVLAPRQIFVGAGVLGLVVPLVLGRGVVRAALAPAAAEPGRVPAVSVEATA